MPEVISSRAIHYRAQAEQFERLADMETQPRARARLLELAHDYEQLADAKSAAVPSAVIRKAAD